MKKKRNILVCPLDWGLGHATRMVPVIEMLEEKGANVIIAAQNRPLDFLLQRFPENSFVDIPGFSPFYPSGSSMALAMLKSMPEMITKARQANKALQKIIQKNNIHAVISDNRYELSTNKIPTILVTHQLNIQTSGIQKAGKPFIDTLINYYINKFDEIWIPDISAEDNLSGALSESRKFKEKKFNIGFLSRFSSHNNIKSKNNIDLLIILSGPEPQRTILEELLTTQALDTKLNTVILLGKPEENMSYEINNVKLISHISDDEFASLVQSAKLIISRPGYSSLMDLAVLEKNAVFIPTPGQTEQEYLARNMLIKGISFSQPQNIFSITEALNNQNKYRGLKLVNNAELLERRIDHLLRFS